MPPETTIDYPLAYGLAAQVERGSRDLGLCHSTATIEVADAEFGRILELMSGEYAALLPVVHDALGEGSGRLAAFAGSIEESLESFQIADDASAERIGGAGEPVSTAPEGFEDPHAVTLVCSAAVTELPQVSFGGLFDRVCDLIVWVGFNDPRDYVTQWIAGDVGKAYTQGEAWDVLSRALDGISGNVSSGAAGIGQAWTGSTAQNIAVRLREWGSLIAEHSASAATIGTHIRDMADQAVQMAQAVVDIIKTVVSLCTAALTNAYIPGYGQWKAIKTVKEAYTLVNNARKVITVFWNALKMIISAIQVAVGVFTITALPPAPRTAP